MAWTYGTLTQAIQDYVETDEATFVANIPIIIKQAEDRILKNVQIPDFRKNVTGSMSQDDQYLQIPADFLGPYSMTIGTPPGGASPNQNFLLFKEVNFIRSAYPSVADTGEPRYYGIWNDDFFIVGPTPDANYPVELHYFYRPESIVDANTSWLGTHAESTLLAACLLESYIFLKGDPDLMQTYEARYKEALQELKILGEGRNRMDSYRGI